MKETLKKIGLGIASLAIMACSMTAIVPAASVYASGSDPADVAKGGMQSVNPGAKTDLMAIIKTILNTVFVVVGIVAVVMIILGGVNYATSQGDPGKASKAKNTIMYAIIGLVVTLLAFAIVNFVLTALAG